MTDPKQKDWTDTEHDPKAHHYRPLSQTGIVDGCRRCDELLKTPEQREKEAKAKEE